MKLVVISMSRGDEYRLSEWLTYHDKLGIDEFHIILDDVIDKSEEVIKSSNISASISLAHKPKNGSYIQGNWEAVLKWREENSHLISGTSINDPISHRQWQYFPEALESYAGNANTWICLLDVDEYIVLDKGASLRTILSNQSEKRVEFLNFNVDMSNWKPGNLVLENTYRWDRQDLKNYGKWWDFRHKSFVRADVCLPYVGPHQISNVSSTTLPPEVARLLHFKSPNQNLGLPYRTKDTQALDFWRE